MSATTASMSAAIPTANPITGGSALRGPVTLTTRIGWVPMVTSTSATMWMIPTAGFYYSPHVRDTHDLYFIRVDGDMSGDTVSYGISYSLFFQVFLQRDKLIYNSSPERREFSNIMKASSLSNAQKSELTFDINGFPLELSKYQAWGTLIAQLALYTPGTFPSDPRIGCGLTYQLFNDEDHMNNIFVPKLEKQVNDYLPDIPLKGIRFIPYTGNISEYAGVYFMTITFNDADQLVTVVTAMKENGDNRIDFSQFFEIVNL